MHYGIGAGLPNVPVGGPVKLGVEEVRLHDPSDQQTLLHSEPDIGDRVRSGIQILNEAAHFRPAM